MSTYQKLQEFRCTSYTQYSFRSKNMSIGAYIPDRYICLANKETSASWFYKYEVH